MYKTNKVSLVFPALNEEKNIARAIKEFKKIKIFDEIIVVDNNSKDNTAKIARKNGVKVVNEAKRGYGYALRKGMAKARGDYIILSEPDGTFDARDALRLVKDLDKYDLVTGTRTNKDFIEEGANMGRLLRYGNMAVAKIMQVLFQTPNLSDCGCTFRAMKKSAVKAILPRLTVGGSHFLPETIINCAIMGFRILEVPVHYRARVGESKITGSKVRSIKVGWNMLKLILKYRSGNL
jgi:glycosyltransferase involved in cell wall biosynthesis